MSFNINSDKEFFRGSKPQLIGDNELTVRVGVSSAEREILRAQLDEVTNLPRVGINRTGERVNNVAITSGGSGYTTPPSVILGPPQKDTGVQALASAFIFNGQVVNIAINNPGTGYTSPPSVTINSESGVGATGEAFLDTVDYELDINGAIRTSTSIISDTARILNLDIDNFITPDAAFRAPNLKNFVNNTGVPWSPNVIIQKDSYRYFGANVYQSINTGKTDPEIAPVHVDGIELNGEVQFKHIGFRVIDENSFAYNQTGDDGIFPRSVTPLLGDRSDKIATTEYVLNLATNDVGGRIYVSQQIGNDENDGRSAVNPVRTVKKACQLAWTTPGVKETVIVSGGDYVEDNPISIPPDASIVGDNLRLVIIRPANPGKHIMKFGDKNYIIGVTYRDQIDSLGDPVATWDFAMVFDDKQRIVIDSDVNGDFGVNFPVGHQIFGPDQFRVDFQENTGLSNLSTGLEVVGINTGSRATIIGVTFDTTIGSNAYTTGTLDVTLDSGSFLEGERFTYLVTGTAGADTTLAVTESAGANKLKVTDDPSTTIPSGSYVYLEDTSGDAFNTGFYEVKDIDDDNSPNHWIVEFVPILGASEWDFTAATSTITIFAANIVTNSVDTTSLQSIRAEGEVVKFNEDLTATLPIQKIDFSLQGDPSIATGGFQEEQFGSAEDLGGIVFYTNELVGRSNIHDFREGEEVEIVGLPTQSPDLSFLMGKQRIYKVLEDADGRARRFVIPKKFPALTQADFDPGQTATVNTYSNSVTLTLLNSPNTFPITAPVERRYQDACVFLRNNRDFIADEVVGRINNEFKTDHFAVYDVGGTPTAQYTPSDAGYDPATGLVTFTVNNHGLSVGDGIRIDDEGVVFTCAMDGYKTEHPAPQSHHYSSGKSLPIVAETTNTFTVNVGASAANQTFTPSLVEYDPSTGNITLTVGPHGLDVGEGVVFEPNSLKFTCNMDGNQSVKTYPRPGIDPYAGKSVPLTAVTDTTISMNIGASKPNQYFTPTDATYNAATGEMVVTIGQHGLGVGRSVVLNNNSFTFTCDQDGNTEQKSYPRPGVDPYAGKSLEILAVGSTSHSPTDAVYDASTGVIEFTVTGHGFDNGDFVKIDDNSLTYSCDIDGNTVDKSYPRANHDLASGRWFAINNKTANTFEINIGPSDYTGAHTFVSADSNSLKRQDGTFTINVGDAGSASGSNHTFITATSGAVKHEPRSAHTFAGAIPGAVKHLPQSPHTFVRASGNAIKTGGSDFKVFLGTSRFEHTYISGGTVEFGGQSYNITAFTYDNVVNGTAVITTASPIPNLAEDSIVRLDGILLECSEGQKEYPSYNIRISDDQCREDVVHFINALVRDLEFGSNFNIIEAAKKYIVGAKIGFVENEIIQTVRGIEYARELAILAMRNWRTGNGTPNDPIFSPQYSSLNRYFDDTVITSTATNAQGVACDDVRSSIDTLSYLWVDVLANNASGTYLDAAYLIARNKDAIAEQALADTEARYPTLQLNDVNQRKCRRDIRFILAALIRDLVLGGNSGIIFNAELYFTGAALTGIDAAVLPQTRYAYERVEFYAKAAMRNWSGGDVIQTTPSFATYDSTNGTVVVSFPDPTQTITTNDRIAFQEGALTFQCDMGSGPANHASPTDNDRNYGKSLPIISVTSSSGVSTVTCNVGDAGTAAGVAHAFVSALTNATLIIYNPIDITTPVPKFEDWNTLVDATGSAAIAVHTPSTATYNPANGDFTVTVNSHGLSTANTIRIAPESFVFTCDMDGNKTEHALPGVGQNAYGNSLQITGTTTNTYTVNVGASGPDQQWTPSDVSYNPATGDLVLTIGEDHGLSQGEGIIIDDNSLTFTCTMDGDDSQKTYPRPGIDPFAGRSMPITSITSETITVNAGISGPNKYFTPSAVTYNASNGDMTVTVGQHGLGVGRSVVLEDNSFTFTCDLDGNASQHTYPRPGSDPYAGKSIPITAVGTTQHTASDAPYNAATGVVTLTVSSHGFANGDYIKIADGSLTYSCVLDGNTVNKAYPRAGYDYPSGRWLQISNVTTNTFDINVGPSSYTGAHTFVSASSNGIDRQDGTFTINVGNAGSSSGSVHQFVSASTNAIKHLPQSVHTFINASSNSVKHLPQSAHTFVRTSSESINVYAAGSAPLCANVESTISTEMEILDGILEYASDPDSSTSIEPGSLTQNTGTLFDTSNIITYPDNFIYDQNNTRMAIRGSYDDYPIIEASPYTQNSSVISFLGGGGALVDGSKVKQPNCPFPGLELDGTATFPNQGKSMVAAAFTIVSFGGTGYKVIEDGYTQLVSVFVIFCADGVLAETGGYCSITNSATNFGIYALRGIGFRKEAYSFDVATITNVSSTPTGRTIFTVSGLGREPLEHYVIKVDGHTNTNPDIEFFIDSVGAVTVGPPFSAQITIDNGTGDPVDVTNIISGQQISPSTLVGETIRLHRPSIVNSSSHTWEFAGSGTNYLALPENGGTKVVANEQVSENYGRVYCSGTDELGDFKVGTFAQIENRTGNITFTGTVTISEVEFLKLKGGDTVVTGFDASNTLGGANSSDSKLPTQKAVRDYITNNLGPYINKPYSTNAVPRALVELTDSGKISVDQIPALRPFEVYTVSNTTERLSIEGALAGDIAIEQDTSTSFILNNDLDSQFLGFAVDPSLQFTLGDIFTASVSGGRIQATEYRQGVVYRINVTGGGSGYASPPTITLSGGTPQSGSVEAKAVTVIANGEVVAIDVIEFNGFKGGKGYTVPPTVTIQAPAGSGTQATASALIESRLYGDIVNRIKIEDTDTIESSDVPSETIDITRAVNTSSFDANNWVSLSSNQISATDIVSGTIESDRLASGGAANSFTFLRGDQNFALAVQSIKGAEKRYFAKLTQNFNSGSSEMIFSTLPEALIGHEILDNVTGIQPNTNITGVLTTGGSTTISVNNAATATIAAGTVIEFERGASPIIFDSTYTQGNFVDTIVISNGGTGFTNGQFFDVDFVGGTGTGLKANLTINGGSITELTVTDGGAGYDADYTITVPPNAIGAGSGLVLLAKISTVNRQYANVAVDVQRVSDLTISSDLYGTIGVARFKKSQFTIGVSGNGSVDLNVGADSGLDADLLDGAQGAFYLNSANQNTGTLPTDRLAGTYNISVSGSAGNALRVTTGTNNPTSNPTPDNFVGGIVANTINNSANQLVDGGSKNLVMTIRAGGSSFDASFGGVRQMAFTDNDNMWLRGSGTSVTSFGSWALMWNSLNDGIGSGMDADKLDNKQGEWYQNALNINYGTISDNRLPDFIDTTSFLNTVKIKSYNGDPRYKIYVSGLILNTSPFVPGNPVNLYNANGQGTGTIEIDNIIINNDTIDNANDYTIIIGRLTSGNFIGALTIGDAGNRKEFQDFTIDEGNTIDIATLESDGGTANLRLGRKDAIASSPGIYFNSSQLSASYNAAIVATGGTSSAGSGTLNVQVENADAFTINGNQIWNAGNIEFQVTSVADTAVKRDGNGGFGAGTITLDNGAELVGAASLNVLKSGDDMTGALTITNVVATSEALSVSGISNFLSSATISGDLNIDSDTFFVDVSNESIGINVGTTLTAGVGLDILGGAIAALRLRGPANSSGHMLLIDGARDAYYDDANHAMMFISSGSQSAAYKPGEGAHWIFNGRASDRDFIFRNNSSNKLTIQGNGGLLIENSGTNTGLDVDNLIIARTALQIKTGSDNSGAPIIFQGASGFRNFRVGNNIIADNIFSIESSSDNGGVAWNSGSRSPALAITVENVSGTDVHRIGINTNVFQGNDPEANNQLRKYVMNVQGDINLNGQFFQNNSEFVTSRWTESPNGNDIYRQSKVGINFSTDKDPGFALDVEGDFNVVGATYIGGVKQYQDSQGIIKAYNTEIEFDVTLDDNSTSYSEGPITVKSGVDIVFGTNATWTIL